MEHKRNTNTFSRADLCDAIRIWDRAAISLIDIRHNLISPEEAMQGYRMPDSAFVYTSGAKAEVLLNDTSFQVERFGLFHGGKGTALSIRPADGWLEYYMLFYKAGEPPFHKRAFTNLLERTNPFRHQYGFAPSNPLFFGHQLRLMYERWKESTPLNLFYGKAALYQLVYEVYEELEQGQIQVFEPDLISMARRYLDRHYGDAITIQEVCSMLGISYSHFHRRFTKQVGKSPQEYLIQTRLSAAKAFLNNGGASIREVSEYCGFQDERNFHRLFAKNMGMSPSQYRKNVSDYRIDYTLGNILPFPYNEQCQVSLDELREKGATTMFKPMKSKAMVAAALSLMLLLSACGAAPEKPGSADSKPASTVTTQVSETEVTEPVKAETKTIHMEYGDVEIPMNPQRVVVIFVQGDLLALGVTPVATSFNSGSAFESQAQDITVIDAFSLSEEEIMALDPDLILWNTKDEAIYQSLSKIAPTLACDYFNMDYKERLRFFGEVFNRTEKAEELIQAFEQKLESAKEKLKEANLLNKSIICVDIRDGFLRAFQGGRGGPLVYDFIGFKAPEKLQAAFETEAFKSVGHLDFSFEVMPEYVGDYILLNTSADKLIDNAVWNNLPPVKEGRLIQASTDMFWFNDIISMSRQLDIIVDAVLASQS